MAANSVEIPLQVNVSTADPNETVKDLSRIPAYVGSSLISQNPAPAELDHTQNNGIYQEAGMTNQYLSSVSALGGSYNYMTEDGQNIQIAPAGFETTFAANGPYNSVSIDGQFIDYVPASGVESVQAISGQYDDMIFSDNGNFIGLKVLQNPPNQGLVPGSAISGGGFNNAPSAPTGTFLDVAYGNNITVGIAGSGGTSKSVISNSGTFLALATQWRTTPSINASSIAFGNGLFVVLDGDVGSTKCITSTDGITWTQRVMPSSGALAWSFVTYTNNTWFALINGTTNYATSVDGITWTYRTSGLPLTYSWREVVYGNGLWVACIDSAINTNTFATSPDGITWTLRTTSAITQWAAITFGNGLFCAVAASTSTTQSVATSPDGITWTYRAIPSAPAANWVDVAYGNGIYVAMAGSTSLGSSVMYSLNGTSWTFFTLGSAPGAIFSHLIYGAGLFLFMTRQSATGSYTGYLTQTSGYFVLAKIDEISPTGAVVNTVTRQFGPPSAGYGKPMCLVRQVLGQSTPFTWASTQYLLIAESSTSYNIFNTSTGAAIITPLQLLIASWAGGNPKYLWCAKYANLNEFVCVAQGGTGNATAFCTTTTTTFSSYCWAIMQSQYGYNRVILTGQTNTATNANYIGISGYNSFTATYALIPTQNAVDTNADLSAASGYAYLDVQRAVAFNHYYSGYLDVQNFGTLAQAKGLFQTTASSQGAIRGFGRISHSTQGDFKPPFEFRVMMAPLYSRDSSGAVTTTVTGAQPVGVSVATNTDGLGNVPMGVPLTTYGEFDVTFAPQIGLNWDTCMWRYNGVYYVVKISSNPTKPIQKISSKLYKINTISPVNVVDSVNKVLSLGSNDYHGGAILTGGTTSGTINFMAYGNYANSVDTGMETVALADATPTPVGAYQPSVHLNAGYYPIYRYYKTSSTVGGIIYDSSGRAISSSTLTSSAYNSVNNYPAYITNPTLPVPLGLNWSGRSIASNSSATSSAFQETYITGGYRGGNTTISSDYDGYLIGNVYPANAITFTLFSTNYLFDGRSIYIIGFNGNYISLPLQKAVTADGLQFIAASQDKAFFLSAFDNSIYTFNGGRELIKFRKFTLNGAITDGVFNVRDNTLMLNATTQWIWMRDNIISFDTKNAVQTGQTVRFYDTTKGIYVGNDFQMWQYGYLPANLYTPTGLTATTAIVPLDFQTAYYGLGANKVSKELDYYITVYNAAKSKTSLNVTIYGFNQDEQLGFVNQNPQLSVVNINPSDYDSSGFYRFSITPRYPKVLASSVGIQCNTKIAVVEVMLRYEDLGVEASFAPNRRART